ncbi:MAG: hypothetical protein HPY90_04710 [Syntrophothermus sp.]|uniref:hypothetical protein n=1 Tax=Syntrophothermus sp. TaxID=2736299 RepID=UPI002579C395|nr:hypothetical protein [Syntrophothermus sp.]NSW82569.1 hypothetical protein [Syntrophothermus sp.]
MASSAEGADGRMNPEVVSLVPRETRDYVDRVIKDFARGLVGRNAMMYAVAGVLRKYGVKRLPLGRYEAVYFGKVGDLPVIHIQGREKMSETCPACGSTAWRYINTERELVFKDYDIITAFCLDCSCFYRKIGWKVDRHASQA